MAEWLKFVRRGYPSLILAPQQILSVLQLLDVREEFFSLFKLDHLSAPKNIGVSCSRVRVFVLNLFG